MRVGPRLLILMMMWIVMVSCLHRGEAPARVAAPLITARVVSTPDYLRLVLGFMGPVETRDEVVDGNLILHFPGGAMPRDDLAGFTRDHKTWGLPVETGPVRQVRVQAIEAGGITITLEGQGPLSHRLTPFEQGRRLVVEVFAGSAALPEELQSDALGNLLGAMGEVGPSAGDHLLVVLDAGHGGHDAGAIGPTGVQEKDVALAITLKAAERLRQEPGVQVVLTRERDVFLPLPQRARVANDLGADLFVSIHANASPSPEPWGIETYYLESASDEAAQRLARLENEVPGGIPVEEQSDDFVELLQDLSVGANVEHSSALALGVQHSMVNQLSTLYGVETVRDLGVKTALFYVLVGTRMPSILVETSFVSNPREERRLAEPFFQEQLATAVAEGVLTYAQGAHLLQVSPQPEVNHGAE